MAKVYLETTSISASKSIAEIMEFLLDAGATNINQQGANRQVVGIRFTIPGPAGDSLFELPARTDSVFRYLQSQRKRKNESTDQADREAAVRIVWRQILYWVKAQFALINIGVAEAQEVFLPYAVGKDGKTLYQQIQSGGGLKQLTGGGSR